jgi:hypothetical protein
MLENEFFPARGNMKSKTETDDAQSRNGSGTAERFE